MDGQPQAREGLTVPEALRMAAEMEWDQNMERLSRIGGLAYRARCRLLDNDRAEVRRLLLEIERESGGTRGGH